MVKIPYHQQFRKLFNTYNKIKQSYLLVKGTRFK